MNVEVICIYLLQMLQSTTLVRSIWQVIRGHDKRQSKNTHTRAFYGTTC